MNGKKLLSGLSLLARNMSSQNRVERPACILLTGCTPSSSEYQHLSNALKRRWPPVELLKADANRLPDGIITCSSAANSYAAFRARGNYLQIVGNHDAVPELYVGQIGNGVSNFSVYSTDLPLFLFEYRNLVTDEAHLERALIKFSAVVMTAMVERRAKLWDELAPPAPKLREDMLRFLVRPKR